MCNTSIQPIANSRFFFFHSGVRGAAADALRSAGIGIEANPITKKGGGTMRRMCVSRLVTGLLVCTLLFLCVSAHATTMTVLYGDKDGFSLGTRVNELFDPEPIANYWNGVPTGWIGDGDGTDVWKHTPGGMDTYIYYLSYNLPDTITSAYLTLFHGGTAEGAQLFVNDQLIGQATPGEGSGRQGNWARLDTFNLADRLFLLDGTDMIEIRTIQGDDLVVDYVELVIGSPSPIPEPSTMLFLSIGVAGVIASRIWKRRAKK